jgi:alpha,alpha-trehalose phosphorylase
VSRLNVYAFTDEQKARNFAYYERLTVRDSSLSACSQAVIAAETGHLELAHDYLGEAALMDLDDLEHNTKDGLDIASLAGVWTALVAGYGGMRHHDHTLSFAPRLPNGLSRLSLGIRLRGRRLRVTVTATSASYVLLDGQPLPLLHHGHQITATIGDPEPHPIPDRPVRATPTQPHGRAPARRRPAEASGTSTDR